MGCVVYMRGEQPLVVLLIERGLVSVSVVCTVTALVPRTLH